MSSFHKMVRLFPEYMYSQKTSHRSHVRAKFDECDFEGLVQDWGISIAKALEWPQSWKKLIFGSVKLYVICFVNDCSMTALDCSSNSPTVANYMKLLLAQCLHERGTCVVRSKYSTDSKFEGILPKGPYLPCVSMAGRALLAGYHRIELGDL